MTTVFPLRNLGPDAEPWGRTIQGAVSGLERDLAQAVNSNNATDQMQTTQLNALVKSQKELVEQQRLLVANSTASIHRAQAVNELGPNWITLATNFDVLGTGTVDISLTARPWVLSDDLIYFEGFFNLYIEPIYYGEHQTGSDMLTFGSGTSFVGHTGTSLSNTINTTLSSESFPTDGVVQFASMVDFTQIQNTDNVPTSLWGVELTLSIRPNYSRLF